MGAGYTQLNVIAPALWVAAIAALLAVGALVYGVVTRQWRLPAMAVGGYVALHLVALVLLPLAVERLVVAPAKGARQLPAIGHNLDATRAAYRLDTATSDTRTVNDGIGTAPTADETDAVARTPLFDPATMAASLQVLGGTQGTRISQVDLDRYPVDGVERAMLVAARQPDRAGLPESGWVQEHLVYTHGNGLVVVPADEVDADGRPNMSTTAGGTQHDPTTYFGEGLDGWWVVVGTQRQQQGGAQYGGSSGIPIGSTFRQAVTSLALGDAQVLLSAELTDQSQLLFRRGLRDRLTTLAPFLSWDSDPYPAVVDGRVVWLIDGYTTSATYPYSQFYGSSGLPSSSDVGGTTLNYLRLAVRATVDATDGTTHLYRSEAVGDDPIIDVWDGLLPGLLEPADGMPAAVRDHLRYPKDLFVVQSTLLGQYHVADAESLFNGQQRWTVSPAAASTVDDTTTSPSAPVFSFSTVQRPTPTWSLTRTYNPGASSNPNSARDELAAIIVADNDSPGTLSLVELQPDDGRQISSPRVAQSAIYADPALARSITLLNANGSKVQFGPMTPQLLDDGLVWVRSLLVSGTGPTSAPRLQSVVAVSRGVVGAGPTSTDALTVATRR